MRATLDGLEFVFAGSGDATYILDSNDGLKGWFEGVEMRHEVVERPTGHGDFDAPAFLGSRLITLNGWILTDSDDAAYEVAMKGLEDLLADGSMSEFAVEQATGTYTCQVRRHGSPELDMVVYGRSARFQLQLWAPDPTKVLLP
jgi:hypothetical protein